MTGLEKIIQQILQDAQAKADACLAQAKAESDQIVADAKLKAEQEVADIQRKSDREVENQKRSAASANDLYRRTEVLKSKQEVIAQVIQTAYETVCGMDADNYFALLEKMVAKNIVGKDGIICFSEKDLNRMPVDFAEKIKELAKNAGGTLTISPQGRQIENGFILIYGGVEDNCTIKALFDAKQDEMQDIVHALLYGKEA